jgi:hypothetical protein
VVYRGYFLKWIVREAKSGDGQTLGEATLFSAFESPKKATSFLLRKPPADATIEHR